MQAYAEELRATFTRLRDEGAEVHARAKALQATEKSHDGLVSVTVGSRGELVRLDLDPRIFRRPDSRHLADSIVETAGRAGERVREQVIELFAPLIPQDQIRAHLDGDIDEVFDLIAGEKEDER
jgi:DNA-binding protein YbaB